MTSSTPIQTDLCQRGAEAALRYGTPLITLQVSGSSNSGAPEGALEFADAFEDLPCEDRLRLVRSAMGELSLVAMLINDGPSNILVHMNTLAALEKHDGPSDKLMMLRDALPSLDAYLNVYYGARFARLYVEELLPEGAEVDEDYCFSFLERGMAPLLEMAHMEAEVLGIDLDELTCGLPTGSPAASPSS